MAVRLAASGGSSATAVAATALSPNNQSGGRVYSLLMSPERRQRARQSGDGASNSPNDHRPRPLVTTWMTVGSATGLVERKPIQLMYYPFTPPPPPITLLPLELLPSSLPSSSCSINHLSSITLSPIQVCCVIIGIVFRVRGQPQPQSQSQPGGGGGGGLSQRRRRWAGRQGPQPVRLCHLLRPLRQQQPYSSQGSHCRLLLLFFQCRCCCLLMVALDDTSRH